MKFYKNLKNTHLPQVEKILLEELNRLCPKVGFFEQQNEKPNKIKELQTVKNTKERSTEIWQNFSKNILLTNIQNSHKGTTLNIQNKSTAYNISKIVTTANKWNEYRMEFYNNIFTFPETVLTQKHKELLFWSSKML